MKSIGWLAVGVLLVGLWAAGTPVASGQVVVANPTAQFVAAGGSVAVVPLPMVRQYTWRTDRPPLVGGAYPAYPYVYQPFIYQPPVVYGNPYASFVTPYQVGYRFPGAY